MMRSGPGIEETGRESPLRVLFFEDCGADIELALRALNAAGIAVKWEAAVTLDEVMEHARQTPYDVVLSDYRMPLATGMDFFEALRAEGIETPFILLTGTLGEEKATECMKRGVADFVLKDHLS